MSLMCQSRHFDRGHRPTARHTLARDVYCGSRARYVSGVRPRTGRLPIPRHPRRSVQKPELRQNLRSPKRVDCLGFFFMAAPAITSAASSCKWPASVRRSDASSRSEAWHLDLLGQELRRTPIEMPIDAVLIIRVRIDEIVGKPGHQGKLMSRLGIERIALRCISARHARCCCGNSERRFCARDALAPL